MTPPAAAASPSVARARRPAPTSRRPSGPLRGSGAHARPARAAHPGLAPSLLAATAQLSRHRLLGRLIAGRAWIALIAFALIGIVTLQLALLELNAGVGRALEREAALQRENASLAIENSELAAGGRVESQASHLGMEFVPETELRFLRARPGLDAERAAAALSAPAKSTAASSEETAGGGDAAQAAQGGEETSAAQSGEEASAPSAEQPGAPAAGESVPAQDAGAGAAPSNSSEADATPVSPSGAGAAAPTTATGAAAPQPSPAATSGSPEASAPGGTQAGATG
jgi:cell division protein FtsL